MAETQEIATTIIDPKSTVNVRVSQIEKGVEKVKLSIAEHGFWKNCPIVVRPHPDSSSQYQYEIILGQCRLRACLELGIEQIPAVVQEMDDAEAIRQSWAENEGRSEITPSDKAHWIHRIVLKYLHEGKTPSQCREIAARFFAISVQTVNNYHPMAFLPAQVSTMLDDGKIRIQDARAIAKATYEPANSESSEARMIERAKWAMKLDRDEKKECANVLEELGPAASIEELDDEVKRRTAQRKQKVEVAIPEDLRGRLVEWGKERGLVGVGEAMIISHMIAKTLRSA